MLALSFLLIMMSCSPKTKKDKKDNTFISGLVVQYYGQETDRPGGSLFIAGKGDSIAAYSFGMADLDNRIPNTSQTKFRMASVSKHFTAFSVYQLIDEGKVSPDTRLTTVLEGMNPVYDSITVGQLLNHTSGIPDYEDLMPDTLDQQLSDADVLGLIKDEDQLYFEPGSQFKYSNTGYCLLSLVTEKISGQPYADYMSTQVFMPQHINALVYEAAHPPADRAFGYHPTDSLHFKFADQSLTSATKGDGGVYIAPNQFARWAHFLMKQVTDGASYAEMLEQNKTRVTDKVDYSMGWFFIKDKQNRQLMLHSGETTGFNNIVVLIPEEDFSISLFTNRDDLLIAPFFEQLLKKNQVEIPAATTLFDFLAAVYAHQL